MIRRHKANTGVVVSPWTRIASGNGIIGVAANLGNTTGAKLIVISLGSGASGSLESFSDSKGNVYVPSVTKTSGIAKLSTFYCLSPIVGAGHTVTLAGTNTFGGFAVEAWGCTTTPSLDAVSTPAGGLSPAVTVATGTVTPAANGDLIFAVSAGQGTPLVISMPYVVGASRVGVGGTNYAAALAYLPQVAAAPSSPSWSWSAGGGDCAGALLAFKHS